MWGQKKRGQQVQILRVEDHCIELDEDALREVLLNDRIKDKDVAVISLAGDFRKGKSFMLSFFLRFLYNSGSPVWLGGPNEPLRGFEWRGGCDRHTTGILIWNEVFLVKTRQGKELAVLLMDTQGMHDDNSIVKVSASIFALSALLSSVLVYNISQNIQENDLQYLQLFADYGQMVKEKMIGKPFQKLLFLVRDWYHISDADFGAAGGCKLLQQRLKLKKNQPRQLKTVRQDIHSWFTEIECFLMPHPGLKVAQEISFDGRLSEISDEFKEQLLHLVPSILGPEKLITKEINGEKITCQQMFTYIKTYVKMFKGDALPQPQTVFEATAKNNHLEAKLKAVAQYKTSMDELCGGKKMSKKNLKKIHDEACARAMETFQNTRKMGGAHYTEAYQRELQEELEEEYRRRLAPGRTKTCTLEVSTCKVVQGVAVSSLAIGAGVFFGVGLPVYGAVCAVSAAVAACAFLGSFIDSCLTTGEKADKARTEGAPCNGQDLRSNTSDTDFLRQGTNQTPQENETTSELDAIGRAKERYQMRMREICKEDALFVEPDMLYSLHCGFRGIALMTFTAASKMAGLKPTQRALDRLAQEIDEAFEKFSNQNASKMGFVSRTVARLRAMFKKSSTRYCRIEED